MQQKSCELKTRLKPELHSWLKNHAVKEERSMNYLINKAVEFYLNQKEGVKA